MARAAPPVRIVGKGPWSLLPAQTWSLLTDCFIFGLGLSLFYFITVLARTWFGPFNPRVEISRSPAMLPVYAAYSLLRIMVAYVLSLAFTLVYGYVAAYNERAERFMVPLLDILQSIPVLSFLPGVMLAMVALFPHHQLGVELGAILLDFYRPGLEHGVQFLLVVEKHPARHARGGEDLSVQLVPTLHQHRTAVLCHWVGVEFNDVGRGWVVFSDGLRDVRAGRQRFSPSRAGFLSTDCGQRRRRSVDCVGGCHHGPVIVLMDQIVWRPVIAWAEKFKMEQVESADAPQSWFLDLIEGSPGLVSLRKRLFRPMGEWLKMRFAHQHHSAEALEPPAAWKVWFGRAIVAVAVCAVVYAVVRAGGMVSQLTRPNTGTADGASATFLRVIVALCLSDPLWTIPVGVAIGFNPRLARIAQPLAQIAASVPATALFPIVLLLLIKVGGGIGSRLRSSLLLLGTQWYILFNVIAGAMAIPTDLSEASDAIPIQLPVSAGGGSSCRASSRTSSPDW